MKAELTDVKRLQRNLSLWGTTVSEKCQLLFVSSILTITIFGLAFFEAAWDGMRTRQKTKKLKSFASQFDMTMDEAESLSIGYKAYLTKSDLLSCSDIREDDCRRLDGYLSLLKLLPKSDARVQLSTRLNNLADSFRALYMEAYAKIGRYAWYSGTKERIAEAGLAEWFEDVKAQREALCLQINKCAREIKRV